MIMNLKPSQRAQIPNFKKAIQHLPEEVKVAILGSEKDLAQSEHRHVISLEELNTNRVPPEEILKIKKFKKYSPGVPSTKLYIKNISDAASQSDLEYIFFRYFSTDEEAKSQLQIQMMQGIMNGQAFVTFPTIEQAKQALEEVHGYILHQKPLIIAFGILKN
eukprot:TRINITY_DN7274_c0_g1_i1.p1 TRINITY_DN7274_c0_g1~~TRINITY_DN7274_c0_g1_i1.p1  ORF type:complete len:162 (+),score=35.68 TRINITY_DN7274_c0_g1_i1:255-740(+)